MTHTDNDDVSLEKLEITIMARKAVKRDRSVEMAAQIIRYEAPIISN